jgi:hypothetical protein
MASPLRTDYLLGDIDCQALAARYQCGYCNSDPATLSTDPDTGLPHIQVAHDPGCPVANGALSALPDAVRAAIPDTFRA